ncbi:hypothetical protein SNE40_010020 [Patella caerulea]|uniref:BHLH domain-containing protein n=1 Tax=Patella caerulea TaxID=87958 RepID=A0AAN8PR44_PATCE
MDLQDVGEMSSVGDIEKRNGQKYNFRKSSVIKRIRVEEKQKMTKVEKPKIKSRPQPLSKYRRKSANLRERTRINDMNTAYEELRLALPEMTGPDNKSKLPKQTILRLALNYIRALRGVLGYEDNQGLNSDGDSNSLATDNSSSEEGSNSCSSPCYLSDKSTELLRNESTKNA